MEVFVLQFFDPYESDNNAMIGIYKTQKKARKALQDHFNSHFDSSDEVYFVEEKYNERFYETLLGDFTYTISKTIVR